MNEVSSASSRYRFAPSSIHRHLTVIMLAALLPTGLFAAVLMYAIWNDERQRTNSELLVRTRTVASLVQGEFESTIDRLRILATDPMLAPESWGNFHQRLTRLLRENPGWANLALESPDGELINASRPFPLSAQDRQPLLPVHRQAFATGLPAISDDVIVRGQGKPSIVIAVPLLEGNSPLALSVALDMGQMTRLLAEITPDGPGVVALIDREGRLLARSRHPEIFTGRLVGERLREALGRSDSGVIRSETQEGDRVFTGFVRLWSGHFVGVAMSSRPFDGALARSLAMLGGILVAMLALGLLLSHWLVARINRHVAQTVAVASRLAAGEVVPPTESRIHELAVITEAVRSLFQRERDAREKEQAAGRAKDEFLAMLGHELRNPLAPILTSLQLMQLRGEHLFRAERGVIERQIRHMQRLVDDLLDIARISRGTIELRREPIELATVVADALETAGPALTSRAITAQVDVPACGLVVNGDAARLCQVIVNLLLNAAKFSESDRVVRISAAREDQWIRLEVKDEGGGISRDELTRIFEPFVQNPQTVDRPEGGLGLGLAIARSIARLHGGELTASSEGPGHGSTFELKLPLLSVEAAPPADGTGGEGEKGVEAPRPLVWIVDDNVDAAESLAELIGLWGHHVRVFHDGRDVVPALEVSRPDIILLDIGLPGLDGYEVATAIRSDHRWLGVRLIALTGYGQAADVQRSLEAGFERHFVKPVDLKLLREVLGNPDFEAHS